MTIVENPKTAVGQAKAPLALVPPIFTLRLAQALWWGARKYGPWNWRKSNVPTDIYVSAMKRHLERWAAGEDVDPETGIPHLGHLAASAAIILDSQAHGTLVDTRVHDPVYLAALDEAAKLATAWPEARHQVVA